MDTIFNGITKLSIYAGKQLLSNPLFANAKENIIRAGLFYGVGFMNAIYDDSITKNVTSEEMQNFNTAHPIIKYNILYRILYNVIPKDRRITIPNPTNNIHNNSQNDKHHNLKSYINESEYNLLGFIKKHEDEPLEDISRLLLPLKFSNLSWYINNQIINNINYIEILEIITLLDVFINVDGQDRFFYHYIQKVKLTGITLADIEFILSLIWFIMKIDLDNQDEYNFDKTETVDKKYRLTKLNNIFNIIFHIEEVNITGVKTSTQILSSLGVTEVFMKDIKTNLIDGLTDPYKSVCKAQIYTLTFAQYIAALLLTIKDNTPLAMIDLGCFQEIFDKVLNNFAKVTNVNMPQRAGSSVVLTAAITALLKPAFNLVYENSTFILSTIDTVSKKYLDFLYDKNITYNELKKQILSSKYVDSFIYVIEDPEHTYPHLRALLLTIEFKSVLSPADRKIFIKKTSQPPQITTHLTQTSSSLFYKPPPTDFTPFEKAFSSIKFKIQTEAIKTFNVTCILFMLASVSGSWGYLIKSYELINNTLTSKSGISTYEYLFHKNKESNIFNAPARLILNTFNTIQKNKTLVIYLRQLMLYQLIYTNTYLLVVDTIASRHPISGTISPSDTDYKYAKRIASKIAGLLYKKEGLYKSVNSIIHAIVNSIINKDNGNTIFTTKETEHLSKCIEFNHKQNIILEVDKLYISEKIGLLKQFSNVGNISKAATSSSSSNNSFVSAVTNESSSESVYNTVDLPGEKQEQRALLREKLFCFFKRIFQYNLAMTSFDIENLLEFNINNTIIICEETRDIIAFYSNKPDMYELYMPTDLTEKVNFLEY